MSPVASSLTLFTALLLLLSPLRPSLCQTDIVVVKLANGGTSKPIILPPLGVPKLPQMPTASPQVGSQHGVIVSHDSLGEKPDDVHPTALSNTDKAEKRSVQNTEWVEGKSTVSSSETSKTTQLTSTPTIPIPPTQASTTTTMVPDWSSTARPGTPTASSTALPSSTSSLPSTERSPPPSLCHQECRSALNATSLQPHTSLTLKQGSMLKLLCEVPLVTSLVLENLVWLYQSDDIAKGQCTLTTQRYIPLCQGFHNITNIYDKNDTLVRDTIIVGNLQGNYSGQYMCQVQITCCRGTSEEHVMNHELSTRVTVWLTDYTVDLAITGSLAVGLVLLLIAGSIYLARQNHGDYVAITDKTLDVKPMTVLHIPLVDDQDNDSFDSNFDEHD